MAGAKIQLDVEGHVDVEVEAVAEIGRQDVGVEVRRGVRRHGVAVNRRGAAEIRVQVEGQEDAAGGDEVEAGRSGWPRRRPMRRRLGVVGPSTLALDFIAISVMQSARMRNRGSGR